MTAPDPRPGGGVGESRPPVGFPPDTLAALIRAQAAVTRNDCIRLLMDAVSHHHLPAHDAMTALAAWDAANQAQRIETT